MCILNLQVTPERLYGVDSTWVSVFGQISDSLWELYGSTCTGRSCRAPPPWYQLYVEATRRNLILPDLRGATRVCIGTTDYRLQTTVMALSPCGAKSRPMYNLYHRQHKIRHWLWPTTTGVKIITHLPSQKSHEVTIQTYSLFTMESFSVSRKA